MRYSTRFATPRFRNSIVVVVACILNFLVSSMTATPVFASIPENFPLPIAPFPESERMTRLMDITTPTLNSLSLDLQSEPDSLSSTSIPEPATIVLFVTAFSSMVAYRLWQRRSSGVRPVSVVTARLHLPDQSPQAERMAMLRHMTDERRSDVQDLLTTIQTCADVLEYNDLESVERKEWTGLLTKEIDSMMSMTRELLQREVRFRQELHCAHALQQSLMPTSCSAHAGIRFDAVNEPATEVGGDFYEYFQVSEHEFVFFIGDVCGTGIPAAMLMASAHSALKADALVDPHPVRVISRTNYLLSGKIPDEMFVTAFYGVYNSETRLLSFINAGHPPALLFRSSTASCSSLFNTNLPLGIVAPMPFEAATIQLEPGDLLILSTDGVSDATNEKQECFGGQRIVELLFERQDIRSPKDLRDAIIQRVKSFTADRESQDDMTVLVVQV